MIIGTAGHVDHGKTSLVAALTGIDTDRLPEEKRRGITLELGFAHLTLPSGGRVGVVDVPGHERFVKAMAAGAGGVDVAMLVVAADEGVMPQTREHLDICGLLGVQRGVIVVTKADLLPGLGEGWLDLLEGELRALCAGTFLEGAACVAVSAKSGSGLEALKLELERQVELVAAGATRSADGPLFVPIDRAFTVKGFGCVVTGTVRSGRLAVGDEVLLSPASTVTRVRSLQRHGTAVERASAKDRVAVNLPGVETADVQRGMALVRAQELAPARVFDVELALLPSVDKPLPVRSRQLVVVGTDQLEAVVKLLDVERLEPGARCFGQVRLARPVAAMPGMRLVLRGTNAMLGRGATIAGASVLTLDPPRRRRGAAAALGALATADLFERIVWLVAQTGSTGLTERELFARAEAPSKELTRALEGLSARGRVVLVDKEARRFVGADLVAALQQRLVALLDRWHHEHPEAEGLSREALRQRLSVTQERTFARVVTPLLEGGKLESDHDVVRLPGRGRAFTQATLALRQALVQAIDGAGLTPPLVADLAARLGQPPPRVLEALQALASEGVVVRAQELFFSAANLAALEARLVAHLSEHGSISTQGFKELTGLSRKFLIPLAEHFDAKKVTLRVGETRVLRKAGA